jgi:hypothetical protein
VVDIIEWSKSFLNPNLREKRNEDRTPQPNVLPKGSIILLKGGNISNEIEAARKKYPKQKIQCENLIINETEHWTLADKKIVIASS